MEMKNKSVTAIFLSGVYSPTRRGVPVAFGSVSDLRRRRWQPAAKYGHLSSFLHCRLTVDRAILTLPPSKHCWHVKVALDLTERGGHLDWETQTEPV